MLILTALSLSPNMQLSFRIGTTKHHNVMRRSKKCFMQARADECSEPHVVVSIVDYFLLCQSIGVLFIIWSAPVTNLPVIAL